jgi:hypothetical protein
VTATVYRRSCWALAAVLYALVLASDAGLLPSGVSGPIDHVVILHESASDTPEVGNVTGGKTVQAIRAAGKLDIYDYDDTLPSEHQAVKAKAEAAQKGVTKSDLKPYVGTLHGSSATVVPLPATEAAFAALIAKQGGI